jgi:hypothetical protein
MFQEDDTKGSPAKKELSGGKNGRTHFSPKAQRTVENART